MDKMNLNMLGFFNRTCFLNATKKIYLFPAIFYDHIFKTLIQKALRGSSQVNYQKNILCASINTP